MRFEPVKMLSGRVTLRRTTLIVGIGFGVAIVGFMVLKRFLRRRQPEEEFDDALENLPNGFVVTRSADFITLRSGKSRRTPSVSERCSTRNSFRSLTNMPTAEVDLLTSLQRLQELINRVERVLPALELVKNRTEKDAKRSELLSSVLDRLRILETDINRIVQDGGYERSENPEELFWSGGNTPHVGTLSVLSDDSFLSAFEELPMSIDDVDVLMREPLSYSKDMLVFYQEGVEAVDAGAVNCRKSRVEFCMCEDEVDFKAKVWCIRQAFDLILSDERNRVRLSHAGRQLIADLLRHSKKDPNSFYIAYDAMMEFLNSNDHMDNTEKELKMRGVAQLGFWDVVLDYVLIDAFEDLSKPPSVVLAVTRNPFLNQSAKESTLATVIWSMLKAKRSRLKVKDGFISHFYDISETASPNITLGFLGTDEQLRELCHYFKEQMCSFILDIFNVKKVRYTSVVELAEDIRLIMETRLEMVQTRLSTELLPPF